MRNVVAFLFIVVTTFCNGQNRNLKNNFTPLVSKGSVPDEINLKSSKKYTKRKEKLKAKKRKDLRAKEKFILQSTFLIDNMISSGAVLFNDELTNYIDGVADEILKDDPVLRSKLKFYTLKSPYVNAFTTDQGIIFVTIGLLAKLENEAQLAFVLSHEISHYVKKHTMKGYLESKKIESGKGEYKKVDWEKKLLMKSNYSKVKESEADSLGLILLKSTSYDLSEVFNSFTVLEHSNEPIEEMVFNKSIFESKYYKFPESYAKKEVSDITSEDEELSTHPSIEIRKDLTTGQIGRMAHQGKDKFITKINGYDRIKDLAQFELVYLYLKKRAYGQAMYTGLILEKKYPFNEFLRVNISYCMYGLAKYRNKDQFEEVLTSHEDVAGEEQRFNYFMEELSDKELNILAVKYLWEEKQNIDAAYIDVIASEALEELIYSQELKKKEFKKSYPMVSDSIKDSTVYNAVEYAFVDLFKNSDFAKEYKRVTREKKRNSKKSNKTSEDEDVESMLAQNVNISKGRALGIDKVALVAPSVRSFDTRKGGYEKFFHGEERRDVFIDVNEFCAEKRGLELEIISSVKFKSSEQYSNLSLLNDWVEERVSHGNIDIVPFLSLYSDKMKKEYNTNYYMWTGIYTLRVKKHTGYYFLFFLGSAAVGIPASIYYALSDSQHTFYYSYLFDMENGDALMIKDEYFKSKDRVDFLKSYVYDTYNQVKQNSK